VSEPIRDTEELGKIAYLAGYENDPWTAWDDLNLEGGKDCWHQIASAVRDAVCPPGFVVVPAAELDALMDCLDEDDSYGALTEATAQALVSYRAALGPERDR